MSSTSTRVGAIKACDAAFSQLSNSATLICDQCRVVLPKMKNVASRRDVGIVLRATLELLPVISSGREALAYQTGSLTSETLLQRAGSHSELASLVNSLTVALHQQRTILDEFSKDDLPAHLQQASDTKFRLGNPKELADLLKDDRQKIRAVQKAVQNECDGFTSQWRATLRHQAKDGDPNFELDMRSGDYNEVLQEAWLDKTFEMKPSFNRTMDLSTAITNADRMVRLGRSWMEGTIGTATTSQALLANIDESVRQVVAEMGEFPVSVEQLSSAYLRTDVVKKWNDAMRQASLNTRSERVRICFYGFSSHGKSSVINSLVGKVLLQAKYFPVTGWPLLVQHNKDVDTPIMTINSDHFAPFLARVRAARFSRYLPSPEQENKAKTGSWSVKYKRSQEKPSPIARLVQALAPQDKAYLRRFEREVATKTEQVFAFEEGPFTDLRKMQESIAAINSLTRICWTLVEQKYFPTIGNAEWPKIEVNCRSWSGDPRKIELLDLPGLGEAEKTMPLHVKEQLLKRGIDGAVCVIKTPDAKATHVTDCLIDAVKDTGDVPLVIYGTHQDQTELVEQGDKKGMHDLEDDAEKEAKQAELDDLYRTMKKATWSMAPEEIDTKRVLLCSPGIWISAHASLGVEFCDPTTKSGLRDFKAVWNDLPCYTWIKLLTNHGPPRGNAGWEALNPQRVIDFRNGKIESCNHEIMVTHFNEGVIQNALDRRQVKSLLKAKDLLKSLVVSQGDIISQAIDHLRGDYNPKADYEASQEVWEIQKTIWKKEVTANLEQDDLLTDDLDQLYRLAQEEVGVQIKAEISHRYHGRKSPDESFRIKTQDDALDLLHSIGARIKSALGIYQTAHVERIRMAASHAWDEQWTSLANLLSVKITQPHLRHELVEMLNAGATSMESILEEYITDQIAADPSYTLKEAYEALARTWISFQQAQDNETKVKTLGMVLSEVDKKMAPLLNDLGFALRPAVPATANSPPLIDAPGWMLPNLDLSEPVLPATVVDNVNDQLMPTWLALMKKESEKTLVGTMEKSRDIAILRVDKVINRKIASNGDGLETATITSILHELITARANCLAFSGAMEQLIFEWLELIWEILPEDMLENALDDEDSTRARGNEEYEEEFGDIVTLNS